MENLTLKTLNEADLQGKIVLVRVDHNVVKKGKIEDPYRIDSTFATICRIYAKGGKPILMTHVGRPKDKKTGEITMEEKTSVMPVVKYLEKKLSLRIKVPEFKAEDAFGYKSLCKEVMDPLLDELKSGKIDMIYLPNTRWFAGEEAKDEKAEKLADEMAAVADVFVNDAFGSWQSHTSTVRVAKRLPAFAGILMEKEIENLKRIYEPARPFLAAVAGSKFDTKIEPLSALLEKADHLVLGGVIYNAYLCAKYGVKIAGVEEEDVASAKKFVDFSAKFHGKIVELPYIVESDTMDGKFEGQYRTVALKDLKPGMELKFVLDAAPETFADPAVAEIFANAKTFFVNAVMGFTPNFGSGTAAMYSLIDKNKDANKLYGGGDTLQDFKKLLPGTYMAAVDNTKYYMFTGGGAVLKAIEEKTPAGMEPVKMLLK